VPIELQQEVKEITDGSVQELLMKLLRAESAVVERKWRREETTDRLPSVKLYGKKSSDAGKKPEEGKTINPKDVNQHRDSTQKKSNTGRNTFQGEASMQHVECYRCKGKEHMAKDCPEKPGAHVIEAEQDQKPNEEDDPWMRTVSVSSEATTCQRSNLQGRCGCGQY